MYNVTMCCIHILFIPP